MNKSHTKHVMLITFIMGSCTLPQVKAQTLISPNEMTFGNFGHAVAALGGDLNDDGKPDVIVGAHKEGPGTSPSGAGRVYIISGTDGSVLNTFSSLNEEINGYFGSTVSGMGGDIDGDGKPDVVVGAWNENPGNSPIGAGRVYFVSGATGTVFKTLASPNEAFNGAFGFAIDAIDDLNGDGKSEIIIGANRETSGTSPSGAGRVYIIDGVTGTFLDTLKSPNEEETGLFGWSVASVGGDLNDDGKHDIIVGAFTEDLPNMLNEAGRAYVFSGADLSLLYTLTSPNAQKLGYFGYAVSSTGGDVDNDGKPDVMVGAYFENPGNSPFAAGRAYIFSGANGALLHTLVSPNEQGSGYFGKTLSGLGGDYDGDNKPDVIIGAHNENPNNSPSGAGRAYIFNGATGNLIETLSSPNEETTGYYGVAVSGVGGDIDGDGAVDVIVGAENENPGTAPMEAGRAYLIKGISVGLPSTKTTASISVYPNPNSGKFNVLLNRSDQSLSGTINITDVTGRTINSWTIQPMLEIDLSSVQPGIYLLQVTTKGEKISQKVFVY